jgi:hypothetical protein
MKNFENRISKLEKDLLCYEDDKNPCYMYEFSKNATDEEIIRELQITHREFARWKKFRNNLNVLMVVSPNFTIEKYLLQNQRELNEK